MGELVTEDHWKERIALISKLGECVGALQSLRFQVDEACRARIDKLLEDVGDPSVLWRDGEHAGGVSSLESSSIPEAVTESVEATRQNELERLVRELEAKLKEAESSDMQWTPLRARILKKANCGVPGHFQFQENGGHCGMCQREYGPRKDKVRLDWLEKNKCGVTTWSKDGPDGMTQMEGFIVDDLRFGIELARDTVRGAIDAAMQRTQGAVTSVSDGGSSTASGASSPRFRRIKAATREPQPTSDRPRCARQK